ncbi:MAG: hypothetical protein JNM17_28815, partial [Archangium sp.]|nr:hypothetical protein [Archangium sp.]
METVEALEATSKKHTEQLEELAKISMQSVADVAALKTDMVTMQQSISGLQQSQGSALQRIGALESDMRRLSEGFLLAAATSRTHAQQLGRLGTLMGELADG